MFLRLVRFLMKPVVLLTLFVFIGRLAEVTGFQINFVAPVSTSISNLSGLPSDYVQIGIIGGLALAIFKTLMGVSSLVNSVRTKAR
jgi:hypothetical protein